MNNKESIYIKHINSYFISPKYGEYMYLHGKLKDGMLESDYGFQMKIDDERINQEKNDDGNDIYCGILGMVLKKDIHRFGFTITNVKKIELFTYKKHKINNITHNVPNILNTYTVSLSECPIFMRNIYDDINVEYIYKYDKSIFM